MLAMIIIGWLVTVGCFLLWVRRLRNIIVQKDKDSDYSLDCLFEPSPIANSEQPIVRSGYVSSQNEPKKIYVHTPSEPELPSIPRGWITWDGEECPVKRGTLVDVMYRDGLRKISLSALKIGKGERDASCAFWDTTDCADNDIIAYRVCKPSETISDKKVSESAKKSRKNKGFSAKAKKKGSARKTVTVKRRVTK